MYIPNNWKNESIELMYCIRIIEMLPSNEYAVSKKNSIENSSEC